MKSLGENLTYRSLKKCDKKMSRKSIKKTSA